MAGAMQSEYECEDASWIQFEQWLDQTFGQNGGDWLVAKTKDADGQLIELKLKADHRVVVFFGCGNPRPDGNARMSKRHVEMHWSLPCVGRDRHIAVKLAYRLEKYLLQFGANCLFGEVRPFAEKVGIVAK